MEEVGKVLLVEDNPGDAFLIQEQVKTVKTFRYDVVQVESLEQASAALSQNSFEVILLDLSLPDSQGLETLKSIEGRALGIPIVILTGIHDADLGVQAVREGAQDYLVKGEVRGDVIVNSLRYAIERKKIEAKLKTRTWQLEAANRELEAFSYMVSHDLRNPLTLIKGMATLLKEKSAREEGDEKQKDYLEHICQASDRMEQIIKDLLILSQVKNSELKLEMVDISALTQKIGINLLQQSARQVELKIQPEIIALADKNLLMHALENLLHNAWKYSSRNPDACIEVGVVNSPLVEQVSRSLAQTKLEEGNILEANNRLRLICQNLVYFVRDNGLGFEMDKAKQLFTPFHRLENAKKFEGTGIGLAIVQSIIHRHNGRIWAEAAAEKGATFYFTLAA